MLRMLLNMPMFLALLESPSLVLGASTTGPPLRRWALTAISTGVSTIPVASLASVLPVQGATTNRSRSFFGPIGSVSVMVCSGNLPHMP